MIGPWWSDPDVTYNASTARDRTAARYAARAWNRSGVGVRLRRTNGRADILVRSTGPGCGGIALLGRRRPLILLGRCSMDVAKLVATHEFGHVLGFRHERRWCALMNVSMDRTGTPARCNRRPWRSGWPTLCAADDKLGARVLARLRYLQVPARGTHGRVAVAAAEQRGVHQQREQLPEGHPVGVAVGQRVRLLVGGQEALARRAEQRQHRQVHLAVAAVGGRIDQHRGHRHHVAAPQVAVQARRWLGRAREVGHPLAQPLDRGHAVGGQPRPRGQGMTRDAA